MTEMLTVAGFILALAGYVWLILTAFKNSLLWGLVTLAIPIVYVVVYWQEAKGGFLLYLAGLVMIIAGFAMTGEPRVPG